MLEIIFVREDELAYFILSKFIIIFLIYFIKSLLLSDVIKTKLKNCLGLGSECIIDLFVFPPSFSRYFAQMSEMTE
jgi:hypothetical protein